MVQSEGKAIGPCPPKNSRGVLEDGRWDCGLAAVAGAGWIDALVSRKPTHRRASVLPSEIAQLSVVARRQPPPEIANRADSDASLRAVRCCLMSREKSSANVQPRPYPASPEAIEFARSGRVDNRPTKSEQRKQQFVKQVLLLLLGAAVIAALVISFA